MLTNSTLACCELGDQRCNCFYHSLKRNVACRFYWLNGVCDLNVLLTWCRVIARANQVTLPLSDIKKLSLPITAFSVVIFRDHLFRFTHIMVVPIPVIVSFTFIWSSISQCYSLCTRLDYLMH